MLEQVHSQEIKWYVFCFKTTMLCLRSGSLETEPEAGFYMSDLTKERASLVAQLAENPPAMQETPVLIPGLERSPGEGIGYPLQYSWASLVAQMIKNPPAMQETWA